jgi:hypothetical protein
MYARARVEAYRIPSIRIEWLPAQTRQLSNRRRG